MPALPSDPPGVFSAPSRHGSAACIGSPSSPFSFLSSGLPSEFLRNFFGISSKILRIFFLLPCQVAAHREPVVDLVLRGIDRGAAGANIALARAAASCLRAVLRGGSNNDGGGKTAVGVGSREAEVTAAVEECLGSRCVGGGYVWVGATAHNVQSVDLFFCESLAAALGASGGEHCFGQG